MDACQGSYYPLSTRYLSYIGLHRSGSPSQVRICGRSVQLTVHPLHPRLSIVAFTRIHVWAVRSAAPQHAHCQLESSGSIPESICSNFVDLVPSALSRLSSSRHSSFLECGLQGDTGIYNFLPVSSNIKHGANYFRRSIHDFRTSTSPATAPHLRPQTT